jgi:serine/threonine-protein kinase
MLIGKILLKRYEVIKPIGGGAFGNTYIAEDIAFPGKPRLVVKHLCPNNSDPQAMAIAKRLFETEAKCLAELGKNDRIPSLFAYFEEDGEFFLVQELIEGHNLTQEFQPGKRWSEAETVQFMQELLEILAFVHKNDTIHRDLKPANIMRRQKDGKLILIDFGAVKEVLTVDKQGQTDLSVAIGTSHYMPPEQATGRPGKYSDVYAVGMLGIQALTGLPSRELPQDSDHLEQIWKDLNMHVDPQLKYVLRRMISFQPKQRFADADEALKALISTVIEPEPDERGASKPKNKLLLILLGIIGFTGASFLGLQFFARPNYAQLETYLANKQWQEADAETDKLILKFAGEDKALNSESSNNISCKSLQTIDRLWIDNSDGRFGFTAQKNAYLATGNEFDEYIDSTYEDFGDRVGWRTFGTWKRYKDLNFQAIDPTITPSGNLPSPGTVAADKQDLRWREREMLLSTFNACQLNN